MHTCISDTSKSVAVRIQGTNLPIDNPHDQKQPWAGSGRIMYNPSANIGEAPFLISGRTVDVPRLTPRKKHGSRTRWGPTTRRERKLAVDVRGNRRRR